MALGELLDRAEQLLGAGGQAMPRRFDFVWQNIAFSVTPEQPVAAKSAVKIEACLGRLPYTAQDAAARSSAMKLANPDPLDLPGRLRIDRDGRVHLVMRTGPVEVEGLAGLLKAVAFRVLKATARLKQLRSLLVD